MTISRNFINKIELLIKSAQIKNETPFKEKVENIIKPAIYNVLKANLSRWVTESKFRFNKEQYGLVIDVVVMYDGKVFDVKLTPTLLDKELKTLTINAYTPQQQMLTSLIDNYCNPITTKIMIEEINKKKLVASGYQDASFYIGPFAI